MRQARALTLISMLALCALVLGSRFPAGRAFAQEGGPVAPVGDQSQAGVAGAPASTAAVQAALGTAFTYQGNLKKNGQPGNTTCSFQFSLWDALSSGAQRGATQTVNNVVVQAGVFSVELDFGNQFTGDARWLQTAVQCAGDAGFTTLAPRQPLNAVPYALSLRPGAAVNTTTTNVPAITANAPGGNANALVATGNGNGFAVIYGEDQSANGGHGVMGKSAKGRGVYGKSTNEAGVLGEGWVGVWGQSPGTDLPSGNGEYASGIVGISAGQYSAGVYGENSVGVGVLGKSASDVGVVGKSANGDGVLGTAEAANRIGVKGVANAAMGVGVWGESAANTGVYGLSQNGRAVWGQSTWGTGVVGESSNNDGIFGTTTASDRIGVKGVANAAGAVGVWGESTANTGVYGLSTNGIGVWGQSTNGPAMRADGNAVQAPNFGGWVKAMAEIRSDGFILTCYNGLTGASSNGCGFTVNHWTAGGYGVDFGFDVSARIVSITPSRDFMGYNMNAEYDYYTAPGNSNTVDVRTFRTGDATATVNTAFMIIVF